MGNPNNAATGSIVAVYIAGEAIGAFFMSFIGDTLGRKRFMQLLCLVVRSLPTL
jgi:MFS family permease